MAITGTWSGACNLRDLGGLRTRRGPSTVHGRVYRSGRIESLDERGWRAAEASGLRTIVDLRNANEVEATDADPAVGDAVTRFATRLRRPIEDQTDVEFMDHFGHLLSHPAYYAANFEFFPDLVREAFDAIAGASGAILFHCSAGRDRTGLVTAVLLVLNDVEIGEVVDDYEAGVRGAAAWLREHPGRGRERILSADELDAAVDDRRRALQDWLVTVDMRALLIDQVGLAEAAVEHTGRLLRDP